jgi:uncharacterized phiE125 gp8 family phage protein
MRDYAAIPWNLVRTVAPAVRVVGIDELKHYLRVTWDEENDSIEDIALAAEEEVEKELSRALTAQTWVLRLDAFPCWEILLPRPAPKDGPYLTSVTQLQYVDADGNTIVLSGSVYVVDTASDPARIHLAPNQVWPATRTVPNAVIITYVAGKVTGEEVPELIRMAIKQAAADMYTHREPTLTGTIVNNLPIYERLMTSHRCLHEFRYE